MLRTNTEAGGGGGMVEWHLAVAEVGTGGQSVPGGRNSTCKDTGVGKGLGCLGAWAPVRQQA